MTAALRSLLSGVIDYAGLFPPARLPLSEAVAHFAASRESEPAWMLRHFILPTNQLDALTACAEPLGQDRPWTLSLLVAADQQEELNRIEAFAKTAAGDLRVAALEIALSAEGPQKRDPLGGQIERLLEQLGDHSLGEVDLFFEAADEEQRQALAEVLAGLDSADRVLGLKLRTGGLEARQFPTAAELAEVIELCETHRIAWKATAGLHHPLPHDCPQTGATMHGFLNLLFAVVLLRAGEIGPETIQAVLTDRQSDHFSISETHLHWQQAAAEIAQIEAGRRRFLCFGSCSFQEPLEELAQLGLLAAATG